MSYWTGIGKDCVSYDGKVKAIILECNQLIAEIGNISKQLFLTNSSSSNPSITISHTGVVNPTEKIKIYSNDPEELTINASKTYTGAIIPLADDSYKLGDAANRWEQGFFCLGLSDGTYQLDTPANTGNMWRFTNADVSAKNFYDSELFSYHRFQYNGTDYTPYARDITGGTYTSQYLTSSVTANDLAMGYSLLTDLTMSFKFKCVDGTQSGSNIFTLYKTNSQWTVCVNEGAVFNFGDDHLHLAVRVSGTNILVWKSTNVLGDGKWHSVTITDGAAGTKFFIDGVQDAGTYTTGNSATLAGMDLITSATNITIGQNSKISLSDLKVYSSVITDLKILNSYIQDVMNITPTYKTLSVAGMGMDTSATDAAFITGVGTWSGAPTTSERKKIIYFDDAALGTNGTMANGAYIHLKCNFGEDNPAGIRVDTTANTADCASYYGSVTASDPYNVSCYVASATSGGGTETAFNAIKGDFKAASGYGFKGKHYAADLTAGISGTLNIASGAIVKDGLIVGWI